VATNSRAGNSVPVLNTHGWVPKANFAVALALSRDIILGVVAALFLNSIPMVKVVKCHELKFWVLCNLGVNDSISFCDRCSPKFHQSDAKTVGPIEACLCTLRGRCFPVFTGGKIRSSLVGGGVTFLGNGGIAERRDVACGERWTQPISLLL
jgi:hypothetical protein